MLYNCTKLIHIVSAAIVILGLIHGTLLWRQHAAIDRIQKLTWSVVIPFSIFQLLSGFMIIGIQHYAYSELWILGSTLSFAIMLTSWILFNYFLSSPHRYKQQVTLFVCILSVLSMIFFMANRVT